MRATAVSKATAPWFLRLCPLANRCRKRSDSQVQPNSAEPVDAISVPFKTVKAHRLDANQ